jgi:uroporphyrin-III C-methyltransferase
MTETTPRRTAPLIDPACLDLAAAAPGTVHLVGGGPGDPGLITVRAAALLASCDLVAYDRLSPPELLDLVPAEAERICVGKTVSRSGWPQEEICRLLVTEARRGRAVVRLKGGDPFVFGRGGEEALACRDAGVPVEVVSGVSSAVAAPAAAGIPVTHRAVATGVAFVTGHEDPTKPSAQVDWAALARFHGTVVVLMGVGNVGRIAHELTSHGRSASTPVAVVRSGTSMEQETLVSDLSSVAEDLADRDIRPPAAIVVGEVVALRDRIGDVAALVRAEADRIAAPGRDGAPAAALVEVTDLATLDARSAPSTATAPRPAASSIAV